MNLFRIIGDGLHQISILWLLLKLIKTKSCGGVSGKTQLLFAIVYTTRYLDVFTNYVSIYNTTAKIAYILCYYVIVLLIFVVFAKTYRRAEDSFLAELLLLITFVLAMFFNYDTTPMEILWAFSIYLEAVAILPQFHMIGKKRSLERSLLYYLIPLGLYRLLYILNWAYRYDNEGVFDTITFAGGVTYVVIYVLALILFYVYKIEVTEDNDGKFFKKNIFLVSEGGPYKEIANEEKSAESEDLERGKSTF